jgi:hypothetical protein
MEATKEYTPFTSTEDRVAQATEAAETRTNDLSKRSNRPSVGDVAYNAGGAVVIAFCLVCGWELGRALCKGVITLATKSPKQATGGDIAGAQ